MQEIPVNRYGNIDVRRGTPDGFVHVPGKRLTVTCRANGIECAPALVDWKSGRWGGPILDGVVVRAEDEARLEEALRRRDARRPSPAQAEARRMKRRMKRHERDAAALAHEIRAEFPGMPEEAVTRCALHGTEIGTGRVGRLSAEYDRAYPAVVAYVRHNCTEYEDLLDYGWDRDESRREVASRITRIIHEWRDLPGGTEAEA